MDKNIKSSIKLQNPQTFEAGLRHADLKEFSKEIEEIEEKLKEGGGILFPEKHLAGLKMGCAVHLNELLTEQPEMELEEALSTVLSTISMPLPEKMVAELTAFLTLEWEKMAVEFA